MRAESASSILDDSIPAIYVPNTWHSSATHTAIPVEARLQGHSYIPPIHNTVHDTYAPIPRLAQAELGHESYMPSVQPSFPSSTHPWMQGVEAFGEKLYDDSTSFARGIPKAVENYYTASPNPIGLMTSVANTIYQEITDPFAPVKNAVNDVEQFAAADPITKGQMAANFTEKSLKYGLLFWGAARDPELAMGSWNEEETVANAFNGVDKNSSFEDLHVGYQDTEIGRGTIPHAYVADISKVADSIFVSKPYINSRNAMDLDPGLYHFNPTEIRFTQSDASPFFRNGSRVDDLITGLRNGTVFPNDLSPIEVVSQGGKLFSMDNRRLLAYNTAQVEKIPVQVVSIKDSVVNERLRFRNDPIRGEGQYIVIATSSERIAAQELLRDFGLIKGIQLGK